MITEVISKLVEGGNLSEEEVTAVFGLMMEGELPESQMAAFLTALRMKGETVSEITGVAKALLGRAEKIDCDRETAVDLCGTGGDGSGTFNSINDRRLHSLGGRSDGREARKQVGLKPGWKRGRA